MAARGQECREWSPMASADARSKGSGRSGGEGGEERGIDRN